MKKKDQYKLIKSFKKFLIMDNAYASYIRYMPRTVKYLSKYLCHYASYAWIYAFFIWDNTSEGESFWRNLHFEWCKKIDTFKT